MNRRVSTEAHTKYAPGKHNEQKLTLYTHKAQFDTVVHRIREQKTKAASHLMHALCDIYLFNGKTKPPLSVGQRAADYLFMLRLMWCKTFGVACGLLFDKNMLCINNVCVHDNTLRLQRSGLVAFVLIVRWCYDKQSACSRKGCTKFA